MEPLNTSRRNVLRMAGTAAIPGVIDCLDDSTEPTDDTPDTYQDILAYIEDDQKDALDTYNTSVTAGVEDEEGFYDLETLTTELRPSADDEDRYDLVSEVTTYEDSSLADFGEYLDEHKEWLKTEIGHTTGFMLCSAIGTYATGTEDISSYDPVLEELRDNTAGMRFVVYGADGGTGHLEIPPEDVDAVVPAYQESGAAACLEYRYMDKIEVET